MPTSCRLDFYGILEVSPRARPEVISAAYKALMKEYHPDHAGSDRVAKQINEAKDILLDREKRRKYDFERNNLTGKVVGNYRILEEIAEGGFGKTYKAEHTGLGSIVCIKHGHYISPQDEALLLEEAKAIWDLRHWSIPCMRDYFKLDDGSPCLVMSYVPGPTLEQVIKRTKSLEPEHVAWIAERSLNALKYLHYHGVVHGDIKPQNIIIQPESHTIVLVDYGLSMIRPTADSPCKGYTPDFASPEQLRLLPLLPESDFYSLGITMIYALGGDIRAKRVPSKTPESLCDFIKRLTLHDINSRPNWKNEDLSETIQKIRMKEFGRASSNMKPLPV